MNPTYPEKTPTTALFALLYADSLLVDQTLRALALGLLERGVRLAGLVQHNAPRAGRSRCDMQLEDLQSGKCVPISQDRGPLARGCALDQGQLLAAMQGVAAALDTAPELLILNKFGKSESEGGGFRPLLADACLRGIPVVIGVSWRNIENWRQFSGGLGEEITLEAQTHIDSLVERFARGARPHQAGASAHVACAVEKREAHNLTRAKSIHA